MTTLVIDGDIVAYQAAAASEQPINWGDGLWTLHSFENDVMIKIADFITGLMEKANTDKVEVALSDKHNFRKDVADYYKANRANTRRPMLLQYAKDFMADEYNGVIWKNLEADDVLGIKVTESDEYLIWSSDKDLKTCHGRHLTDEGEVYIDEQQADYWFLTQVLTGDSTDNYPGCPKVGAKTAEKLLAEDQSWDTVVAAYSRQNLSEEVAIEQARLARILRSGEYNHITGEVTLWNPKN
jgi:DNA polymerase-1